MKIHTPLVLEQVSCIISWMPTALTYVQLQLLRHSQIINFALALKAKLTRFTARYLHVPSYDTVHFQYSPRAPRQLTTFFINCIPPSPHPQSNDPTCYRTHANQKPHSQPKLTLDSNPSKTQTTLPSNQTPGVKSAQYWRRVGAKNERDCWGGRGI